MSTKKLIAMLNDLGRETEQRVHCLNNGGCAVFAAHVGYALKYRLNVDDVGLRVGHPWRNDNLPSIKDVREEYAPSNVKRWNNAGVRFGHVIVELVTGKTKKVTRHYDSSGVTSRLSVTNNFGFALHPDRMSVEEGLILAATERGWNSMFDRRQIPTIIDVIDKHVNKYISQR